MKNINYKVDRDNVHIGTIVKAKYVDTIDKSAARILKLPKKFMVARDWKEVRQSVLFVPDENKRMNDLLYDSPAYRVLNITPAPEDPDDIILASPAELIVNYPYNISEILAYLGYQKELTYGDILKIKKVIFSPDFCDQFCELFGFRETYPTEVEYYENDVLVDDPKEIEKKMKEFDRRKEMGERGFSGIAQAPLDSKYFDILKEHSDPKYASTKDVFVPNRKIERNVKKLSLTN